MRVKTFFRVLRILSAVVLFFFMWTFGSVWEAVAFAVTSQKADARGQKTDIGRLDRVGAQKPEELFEKALENIRGDFLAKCMVSRDWREYRPRICIIGIDWNTCFF